MASSDSTVKTHPSRLMAFLWWCAGADPRVLQDLAVERTKYAAIGSSVLLAASIAVLSSISAFYAAFDSIWWALICAVPWAIIALNLDRYIISSMINTTTVRNAPSHFLQNLLPAIPRFLLATAIGIVIATPLSLAFFAPEIEKHIQIEREKPLLKVEDEITRKQAELSHLNEILQAEERRLNEVRDSYFREVSGTGGTRRKGEGPVARLKRYDYEQAEHDFTEKRSRIEQQITEISADLAVLSNRDKDSLAKELSPASKMNTLLVKWEAFSILVRQDRHIAFANYSIVFLIILIETCPITLKLLSSGGRYEAILTSMSGRASKDSDLYSEDINSELQKAFVRALDHSTLKPRK